MRHEMNDEDMDKHSKVFSETVEKNSESSAKSKNPLGTGNSLSSLARFFDEMNGTD